MKKIFLCSSFADVAPLLSESLPASLKGKTVAFIPTASVHEEYTQYVEDGKNALVSLGFVVRELDIAQCGKKEIAKVLNDCDCIYISGGNTFFLMQELRRTGTDKLIVEQVEKGKLYIGESAGAMIFAPNIEYAKRMDNYLSLPPDFKDFTGLGIIDFYPVVHFNSFPFEETTQKIIQENSHLPLKPITNEQAIVILGNSISIQSKQF
ncbi:Type 1 glutamine amidotransferase-like domain-containing protein [Prevotella falsenii]|uniref:Type 1 glutamine amidotransferase-like domain-containing protein n=1 Tax=Prevotella falsenii TaxID=515414 RepID=UPI000AC460A5|nr:Type 1 glutamine amidotransferase-like domain-containing protein [Prevotella falsenii]